MRICVSKARIDGKDISSECGFSSQGLLNDVDPSLEAYRGIPGVTLMDINSSIITDGWVNPIVGNVVVYRDSHHITNLFAETLTPMIEEQMFGRKTIHPLP